MLAHCSGPSHVPSRLDVATLRCRNCHGFWSVLSFIPGPAGTRSAFALDYIRDVAITKFDGIQWRSHDLGSVLCAVPCEEGDRRESARHGDRALERSAE